MTQEVEVNRNIEKNYLTKDHKGVLVDKSMIKERDGWIYFLFTCLAVFLVLTGWFPFFEDHREIVKLELIIGGMLISLVSIVGYYLSSRKRTGVFQGNLTDLINAFKTLGVHLNHFPKGDKCYEIQAEPITLSRKELVLVKDCGDFCEIIGKKGYIRYLARYLKDLELK